MLTRPFPIFNKITRDEKTKLIFLSIVIGLAASLLAGILKFISHKIQEFSGIFAISSNANYHLLFYPIFGIFTVLLYVKIFRKGYLEKGLSGLIYSSTLKEPHLPLYQTYSQIITSSLTVGFGGSVGLEAPTVLTGAAVGSNIGKFFKANQKVTLTGCGAASALAAIFNCPIAGVIFCIEVLLLDFSISHLIPLLISSSIAAFFSNMLFAKPIFFLSINAWNYNYYPFFIILGLFCGFISAYMIKMTLKIESFFSQYHSYWIKGLFCSLILGMLIFIFPPLFGDGFYHIQAMLEGKWIYIGTSNFPIKLSDNLFLLLIILMLIILLKPIAAALTISAGGNGGIFAPSLFVGCISGFFFVFLFDYLHIANLNYSIFCALGMAGILSGVIKAPLTAIFLIAELTGGYSLFAPLMIVCSISFLISRKYERYSIYTKLLAETRNWTPEIANKNLPSLKLLKVKDFIESDFLIISPSNTLRDIIKKLYLTKRNLFPVVDSDNKILGLIKLDIIKENLLNFELYDLILAQDLMESIQIFIEPNDNLEIALKKFEESRSWNLPVIEQGKYLGFISKSAILQIYSESTKENTNNPL